MQPLHILRFFACALLLTLSASCRPPADPIRISINAWPGYEFLYLAQEKGFFAEEGVEVRLVEFGSLSDVRRAYERGQIDGMASTLIEVIQARDISPRTPQVFLVVDYSNGADVIMAPPAIKSIPELKGKHVGLELASLNVFLLARALEKHGLGIKDVQMIGSDQLSMEQMFRQGELDALVTYPPTSLKLEQVGHVIFSSADVPGEIFDVLALDATIIQQRPQEVAGIARAFLRAVDYARAHPEESNQIMGQREGISADQFGAVLEVNIQMLGLKDQARYFGPDGQLQKAATAIERVLRESGQIAGAHRDEPIEASGTLDLLKR